MDRISTKPGRQHILDHAEQLFTERGYQAVSIRDIAQACSVTNAALYYHFANKSTLFLEVMEQHSQRINQQMKRAASMVAGHQNRVIAMLLMYAEQAAKNRPLFLSLRREISGVDEHMLKDKVHKQVYAMLSPIDEEIRAASKEGELISMDEKHSPGAILVGMLHGIKMFHETHHERSISASDIELIVDIFWQGLSPDKQGVVDRNT